MSGMKILKSIPFLLSVYLPFRGLMLFAFILLLYMLIGRGNISNELLLCFFILVVSAPFYNQPTQKSKGINPPIQVPIQRSKPHNKLHQQRKREEKTWV